LSQKKNTTISSWRWISGSTRPPDAGQAASTTKADADGQAGSRVYFKNIRIRTAGLQSTPFPKGIYVVNNLTPGEKNSGWHLLFDGKTSQRWICAYKKAFTEKGWEIKNGTIPVLDNTLHPDAKLGRNGDRTMASPYDLIPASKQERFIHPMGQWNTGRIIVYPNNHVEHYLKGVKVLEYERGSQAFRDLVAISQYKVWKNFGEASEGHILLQDHGNLVCFRSIKIRELN
jgi:hypothetical protein